MKVVIFLDEVLSLIDHHYHHYHHHHQSPLSPLAVNGEVSIEVCRTTDE